jgi:hypothetical protein
MKEVLSYSSHIAPVEENRACLGLDQKTGATPPPCTTRHGQLDIDADADHDMVDEWTKIVSVNEMEPRLSVFVFVVFGWSGVVQICMPPQCASNSRRP